MRVEVGRKVARQPRGVVAKHRQFQGRLGIRVPGYTVRLSMGNASYMMTPEFACL